MPTAPKARSRPWLGKPAERPNQGRYNRTAEYDTARWRKARKLYLQEHPLCVECKAEGRITAATVLDHKQRVNDGGGFWDQDNWQGLCTSHHSKKSARGNGV